MSLFESAAEDQGGGMMHLTGLKGHLVDQLSLSAAALSSADPVDDPIHADDNADHESAKR